MNVQANYLIIFTPDYSCTFPSEFRPAYSTTAIAIALGYYHTCVIVTGGGLKCWGNNDYGQLGNGGTSQNYYPANVYGGTSFSLPRSYDMACEHTRSWIILICIWGARSVVQFNMLMHSHTCIHLYTCFASAIPAPFKVSNVLQYYPTHISGEMGLRV